MDSDAFAAIHRGVYALLERDIDADGHLEVVVALRATGGWKAALFAFTPNDDGGVWQPVCEGATVQGSELGALSWVEMVDGPLVLIVGHEENPDEVIQAAALSDPAENCAPRLEDRMVLTMPDNQISTPSVFPRGATVTHGKLVLEDRPEAVTLVGPEGSVDVVTHHRVRTVGGSREIVEVREERAVLLEERRPRVAWVDAGGRQPLAMVTDRHDSTMFVARTEEAGSLFIAADNDIHVLILHHGCPDDNEAELSLRHGAEPPWRLGTPVPPGAFVMAAGRSHAGGGAQRELLALTRPTREIEVALEPTGHERCVREIAAFGYAEPTPPAE